MNKIKQGLEILFAAAGLIITIGLLGYLGFGYLSWLINDPLHLFQ